MNETAKTLTFLAVAAAAVLLAVVTRPSLPTSSRDDVRGQLLYPDFKDPLAVASLEIVEFDESTATVHPFQVAEIDYKGKTRWVIPSHDNYPADAKEQVAAAATALMGLKILDMPSDAQGDQPEYGVVEPDPKVLKVGATGVGMKVVMKNKEGKELLGPGDRQGSARPRRPALRPQGRPGPDLRRRGQHGQVQHEVRELDRAEPAANQLLRRETALDPRLRHQGHRDGPGDRPTRPDATRSQRRRRAEMEDGRRPEVRARPAESRGAGGGSRSRWPPTRNSTPPSSTT